MHLARTTAAGVAGGALLTLLKAPLAWLLGSMAATIALALMGFAVVLPNRFRTIMVAILGVMIGAAFTPEVVAGLADWWKSVAVMLVFIGIASAANFQFLRRVVKLDTSTAFFSSAPGGIGEMAILGGAYGGDLRVITVMHTIRIAVAVATIPFIVRWLSGGAAAPGLAQAAAGGSLTPSGALVLAGCVAIGLPLASWARLPAAALVGPMLASILVHGAGFTREAPPRELVAAAQVIVGIAVGMRFGGRTFDGLGVVAVAAVGVALALVAGAICVGWAMAPFLGLERVELMLALAPGGVAEMSLVALSIGIVPAFISAMHIVRITFIIALMPWVYRWAKGPPS